MLSAFVVIVRVTFEISIPITKLNDQTFKDEVKTAFAKTMNINENDIESITVCPLFLCFSGDLVVL